MLYTKTLEKNVSNVWGEKGREWLSYLPDTIQKLSNDWSLTKIQPVNNMTFNFVALARQADHTPVVLKISCDKQLISDEYNTLQFFNDQVAVKVLNQNEKLNALLLEQAIPGISLKEHGTIALEDRIQIYADVAKTLSDHPKPQDTKPHVSQWCKAIDRITDSRIPRLLIDHAKQLRSNLLNSAKDEYLCHGDLHLDNILQHHNEWVIIDPKGIIGELAFEAAAFDLLSPEELKNKATISEKIIERIKLLSDSLNSSFNRLLSWFFLRAIISAQWHIEDKGDPQQALLFIEYLYPFSVGYKN